jgi:hypothetical protein
MISLLRIMIMPTPKRVSEAAPVQVYLDRQSRDRLDHLAKRLELTRSDVLRRGLLALEREASDPLSHPVLRLATPAEAVAPVLDYDAAREHDRFLASVHEPEARPAARRRSTRSRG